MKKVISLFLLFLLFYGNLFSQNSKDTSEGIWVTIDDSKNLPIPKIVGDHFLFENEDLRTFFMEYNITKFSLAFPAIQESNFKNKRSLDKVYEIKCNCDINTLKNEMERCLSSYYSNIEFIPEYDMLYSPNDYTILYGIFGPNW